MTHPIINIADAESVAIEPEGGSDKFGSVMKRVGPVIGAKQLGCSYMEVPPGKRAFPFHNHHANEEMFIIVSGTGEIRIGEATHPIRAGDVIACPAGGQETAHQIINSGSEPLKYYSISTKHPTEIGEYPDSGKFIALAYGDTTGAEPVHYLGRKENTLDYWEGEV
ncbi:MAG: cupin domain-containing protein [Pseudomonadota bacterium]